MIKMILACDLNGVIGKDGDMPWKRDLPYDLKRFKELTEGNIVVMGRKTFDSLNGMPLPNRENVVLTKSKTIPLLRQKDLYFSNDIGAILDQYDYTGGDRDLWIIGGMQVYKQFMPYVQEVYLTRVDESFEGDTELGEWFFEELMNNFKMKSWESKYSDSENKYSMYFTKHVRIKGEY